MKNRNNIFFKKNQVLQVIKKITWKFFAILRLETKVTLNLLNLKLDLKFMAFFTL